MQPGLSPPGRLLVAGFMILFSFSGLQAQERDSVRLGLLNAKAEMNRAFYAHDPEGLNRAQGSFRLFTESEDPEIRKLAYYYMGYSAYRLGSAFYGMDEKTADRYRDEAIRHLEKATEIDGRFAEAVALLGNCYGMKATGFFSGMKYGPKSQRELDKAIELAPDNPRVRLIYGISFMFKPSVFGGSLERAIEEMEKAAALFADRTAGNELYPEWGRAEVYAWLGQACERNDDFSRAEQYYRRALEVDDDYYWVKEILLPELSEKKG